MTIPFWDETNAEAYTEELSDEELSDWDKLYLGGERIPGLVSWPGGKRKYDVDEKKGRGKKGAKSTQTGKGNDEITFTVKIWTPAHFERWQQLLPLIGPTDQKPHGNPLVIAHPGVNLMGVTKVLVTEIDYPKRNSGAMEFQIKMKQWGPPNKTGTATPTKAKDKEGKLVPTIIDGVDTLPKDDAKLPKADP
jgi:hypothetical protein